jgi:hypothetical protein
MKMKKIKESKDLNNLLNDYWIIFIEGCFFIKPGVELIGIVDLINSWEKLIKRKLIIFVNKKNEDNIIKLSHLKKNNYQLTQQLLQGQMSNYQKDTNDFMKKLYKLYEK